MMTKVIMNHLNYEMYLNWIINKYYQYQLNIFHIIISIINSFILLAHNSTLFQNFTFKLLYLFYYYEY